MINIKALMLGPAVAWSNVQIYDLSSPLRSGYCSNAFSSSICVLTLACIFCFADISKLMHFFSSKAIHNDYRQILSENPMLACTDMSSGAGPADKVNLRLADVSRFATDMFAQGLKMETRGISGTMDFVAWELHASLAFKVAPPAEITDKEFSMKATSELRGVNSI